MEGIMFVVYWAFAVLTAGMLIYNFREIVTEAIVNTGAKPARVIGAFVIVTIVMSVTWPMFWSLIILKMLLNKR